MKRIFTLLLCTITALSAAWGAELTFDFNSSIPKGWTASVAPNGYETTGSSRGTQFTKESVLTLKNVENVTKVQITCSANIGGTISASVAGTSFGSAATLTKETDVLKTFEAASANGDLTIKVSPSSKSIWINKIVVTCDASDGGNGGNEEKTEDDLKELDANYVYPDSVIISYSGETIYNQPYKFIQNNVMVQGNGTLNGSEESYFAVSAGNSISFTATQEIKAILINGYVKEGFDAECNNGILYYVDAFDGDVISDPVVVIDSVDSKTVTLTCIKQMRCYDVTIYFNEYPDLEDFIYADDDDDDWDFDWDELFAFTYEYEPTEKKNIDLVFDEAEFEDITDEEYTDEEGTPIPASYIILGNDDFELDLIVYGQHDPVTMVTPGTYAIDTTGVAGTVFASPGYSEWTYDYPSFMATDFYQEDGEWYYETSYYLVSGTVKVENYNAGVKVTINATTYNGSTIKATYTGKATEYSAIDTLNTECKKRDGLYYQNGKVVILKDNSQYNLSGMKLR